MSQAMVPCFENEASSQRETVLSPHLDILILNYNGCDDTIACVESILKGWREGQEIVVVDNGSEDGSVEKLRRWAEEHSSSVELASETSKWSPVLKSARTRGLCQVTILQSGRNLGFAGGNNLGIRYSLAKGSKWILLLNNDTIVEPDTLSALIDGAERSGADLAGCRVYKYDRPLSPWYLGGTFNWWGDRTVTSPLLPAVNGAVAVETDWITGCCLLVRREVFEVIGLLDQHSFLYYEDVDFCRRAAKAGFKRLVVVDAKIYHKISRSAVLGSALSRYHATRSRLYFHRKSHSRVSHLVFLITFAMSRMLRSLIWLVQRRPDLIKASWTALCEHSLRLQTHAGSLTSQPEIQDLVPEQERK
jgi:GT2 family glycosyltransferase